jgi:hypothetical protein
MAPSGDWAIGRLPALPDGFALRPAAALIAFLLCAFGLAAFGPRPRALAIAQAATALFPAAGIAVFALTLFAIQIPVQAALVANAAVGLSPFWLGSHVWALPVALALIAAVLQEGARRVALWLGMRLTRLAGLSAPLAGAWVGAGIDLVETTMVLGAVAPDRLHLVSVAVLERIGAVAFHTGAGGILGVGVARRRVGLAFALVVVAHFAIDALAALYGVGAVPLAWPSVWGRWRLRRASRERGPRPPFDPGTASDRTRA